MFEDYGIEFRSPFLCKNQIGPYKMSLNIENISDTSELLNVVYKAWDELTHILSCCFKDMTEDDWDNVKTSEVIAVVIAIFKDTMVQFANIPNNSKN